MSMPDAIEPALAAGQRVFGENYVQEAKAKWGPLRQRYPGVELHLIGPLQTNKVREAVELFDAIHSLDREKLADALKAELTRRTKPLQLFIEVNTGEEAQKTGIAPKDTASFVRHCRDTLGLSIIGLMCIPPLGEPAALHFALLRKLALGPKLTRAFWPRRTRNAALKKKLVCLRPRKFIARLKKPAKRT